MSARIDLTGMRYGRLTVLSYAGAHKPGLHAKWLCRCECGETTTCFAHALKTGQTTSCGCRRREVTGAMNKRVWGSKRSSVWGEIEEFFNE